jgi:fermentation-respiration switch protein FrsA (DUF1100 family)
MLINILVPVAIAYAVVVALLFVFQARLVYFPHIGRAIMVTPHVYGLDFESVSIRTEDGETLHAWWVPATSPGKPERGTVLFLHGNAGNISHRLDYLMMFKRLGFATLIVDYRGYGQSTGTPSEEGTYRDASAALRWLSESRGILPGAVVLVGESLGGAVASWLAARHRPRALVLLSTFTSVPDLGAKIYPFLPVRLISRFSYDNLERIVRIKAPVFVAHSRDDDIVPFAHGRALFAAAGEPKQFLEMRGGHNDGFIFMRDEWVRALAEFLERNAASGYNLAS